MGLTGHIRTDITYTAVAGHRAFVIGIVDWFSRKVLAYNVVNTMDAFHCVETLKTAMDSYGKPEIFNSDQGSQFTSSEFVTELRKGASLPVRSSWRNFGTMAFRSAWTDGDGVWIMQKWSVSGGH